MKRKNIELEPLKSTSKNKRNFIISEINGRNANQFSLVSDNLSSKRIQTIFPNNKKQSELNDFSNQNQHGISSKRNLINGKYLSLNNIEVFDLFIQNYFLSLKGKEQKSVENKSDLKSNKDSNSDLFYDGEKKNDKLILYKIKIFTIEDAENFKNKNFSEFNFFPLNKFFEENSNLNLNEIQKLCFDYFYKTNEDYLLAAPNGCGKSKILKFAIAKAFAEKLTLNMSDSKLKNDFKIIYFLESKEKCKEKFLKLSKNFSENFPKLKLFSLDLFDNQDFKCMEITLHNMLNSNIIFTTAYFFEVFTLKNNKDLFENYFYENISLIIYDSLNYIANGASNNFSYETLITRLNFLKQKKSLKFRTIGTIARIDNLEEIAAFLKIERNNVLFFPKNFDQLKIKCKVIHYELEFKKDAYEKKLMNNIPKIITENLKQDFTRNSILIVCSNAQNAKLTCEFISQNYSNLLKSKIGGVIQNEFLELINDIKNDYLSKIIKLGMAFYDMNLFDEERNLIKSLFHKGISN
jgi:hypothetical protein